MTKLTLEEIKMELLIKLTTLLFKKKGDNAKRLEEKIKYLRQAIKHYEDNWPTESNPKENAFKIIDDRTFSFGDRKFRLDSQFHRLRILLNKNLQWAGIVGETYYVQPKINSINDLLKTGGCFIEINEQGLTSNGITLNLGDGVLMKDNNEPPFVMEVGAHQGWTVADVNKNDRFIIVPQDPAAKKAKYERIKAKLKEINETSISPYADYYAGKFAKLDQKLECLVEELFGVEEKK